MPPEEPKVTIGIPPLTLSLPQSTIAKAISWLTHFRKRKKILLIGGGEIGTEIGLAALGKNWLVRAIASEKLPAMSHLLYYFSGIVEDCLVQAFTNDASKLFQYVHPREISNLTFIAECVNIEQPDIVLLEDVFMTSADWKSLYTLLSDKKFFEKKKTFFLPSPVTEIKTLHKTFIQSDIFLDKEVMKNFLEEIGEGKRLLGLSKDKVSIQSLRKLAAGVSQQDDLVEQMKGALKGRKLVFKAPMSSSGYGQFVLSDISELTTSFLSKMVEIQKLRVKNDRYLYEKYVADREEYSTVLGVCKDSRKCIDGISYKKYDPECYPLKEQYSNEDIQGTVRLLYSDTKKDQTSLWHDFRKKSESLLSVIKSPFLYVEFIVDKDKNVPSEEGGVTDKQPLFFINEISYRPDDAGFISRISHKLSQFELFMDSLEAQLKANGIPKSDTLLPIEPLDEYCCFTLIPLREILFILNELNHEHGAGQTQMKFRLYEKTLPKVEGEIPLPSRRIIGYLMHHSSQDGIEILKTRLKNLDLSTDTVVTLLEALELTKKQIDTNRKGLSGVGI